MIRTSKRGFTILELALAMAFISFLLLLIGVTTSQLAGLYQRGLTLANVNEQGRSLVDEFTRGITASVYEDEAIKDTSDFYFERVADLGGEVNASGEVPLFGAFCTGTYTYLWNTGYALGLSPSFLTDNPLYLASWQNASGDTIMGFRLLRVSDYGRGVCNNYNETVAENGATNLFKGGDSPTELLPEASGDLALYDFKTFKPAYDKFSKHALYSISFLLGSIGRGVDITASGDFCKAGYGGGIITDFTYCAVNKFNFAARATGGLSYGN